MRTPDDVARALAALTAKARKHPQFQLRIEHPSQTNWEGVGLQPGPTGQPPERSAVLSGREVYLHLEGGTFASEERLGFLWGLAVPLGFVPWDRYPLPSSTSQVFHHWGPWALIEDHLLSAGRGEAIWPSLCAAGQCDGGVWEGASPQQRLLQAYLHRLGYACGPIDGILGASTNRALASAGLGNTPLNEALGILKARTQEPTPTNRSTPKRGRIILDAPTIVHTTGGIKATRTPQGYVFAVTGEGRIIVDVGV